MDRTPVSSSNIASIGYDSNSNTLEVEFHNGGLYEYYDIPQGVYDSFMKAPSHGTYFDVNIKKAGYKYRKLK